MQPVKPSRIVYALLSVIFIVLGFAALLIISGCSSQSKLDDCNWTLCQSTGECDGCGNECGGTPGCPGDGQGPEYSPYYYAPWFSYYPCTQIFLPDRPPWCDASIRGATNCAYAMACCTNTVVMAPFGQEVCSVQSLYMHCEDAAVCAGCALGDTIDPDTGNCAP
jgi:hypothetical protein